jgi:hypothetical protein
MGSTLREPLDNDGVEAFEGATEGIANWASKVAKPDQLTQPLPTRTP